MWITRANEATRRLYIADFMDKPVVFGAEGRARVTAEVGERLIAAGLAHGEESTDNGEEEDDIEDSASWSVAGEADDESEVDKW